MKPTLSLCEIDFKNPWNTLGLVELLTFLKNSDLFDITYHQEKLTMLRGERASTLYYNGKKIFLDLWDYSTPTYTDGAFNAKFDLIIKLQGAKVTEEQFEKGCLSNNMFQSHTKEERLEFFKKVITWTFFCSKMMKQFINKEEEIQPVPVERFAFFCGKGWKCRRSMKKKLAAEGMEILDSDQGGANIGKGKPSQGKVLTNEQYLQKMQSSKFGLVLHGRGAPFAEGKNRREIDYMMLKKPLLLNYRPYYYNPLIEGKHYIYIDEKTNFKNLESMYNINEIAMNGYEWYKNNASPMGAATLFLQIMNDKGFNENR